MKVLQINAIYGQFSTGRLVMELHEVMTQNGVESFVACPNLSGLQDNMFKIGNLTDRKIHALLSRVSGKQGYFSWMATQNLLAYMDEIQLDVVHLHNLHGNYLNLPMLFRYLRDKKIAVVVTLHDCWCFSGKCMYYIEYGCQRWKDHCGKCPAKKSGNKSWFFDFSSRLLADKARWFSSVDRLAVIGVSRWITEGASQSILKNASIIQCIYNWIDLEIFRPAEESMRHNLRAAKGLENKRVVLGVAAGWNAVKGINIFYQLADLLPEDCQIVLVGDCSDVKKRNPKIYYWGKTGDVRQLAQWYNIADVFVNPTIQETFGLTTAEALACGTPVVAFDGTATPELMGRTGDCGVLVQDHCAEEYRKAIETVLQSSRFSGF